MENEPRICAILFADIAKSSEVKGDILKTELARFVDSIASDLSNNDGIIYVNTWGDGIVAVGRTCGILAEEALKIRDRFRNTDWSRKSFSNEVRARIGLDLRSIILVHNKDNGDVQDITGEGVDQASRLEPIVDTDHVFCTSTFRQHLGSEGVANVTATAIGERELAKSSGTQSLFDLTWVHEAQPAPEPPPDAIPASDGPRIPRIKGRITDRDRDVFAKKAFATIKRYFEEAANKLATEFPEVDATVQTIHTQKFVCDVYIHGDNVNRCKIWLSQGSYMDGIAYAEGQFSVDDDSSYNENIRVEDDGHALFLKPLGMRFHSGDR